tara:strand:- start:514 stop:1413 length:900 start_codon:yes stop_codon:yes gene_type:complete
MQTKKIDISVALIQDCSSYVCLRRKSQSFNNYIEFPGGKLLAGESASDCLLRETNEELDIDIKKFKFIGTIKHLYEDLLIKINVYKIFKYHGDIHSNEGREIVAYSPMSNLKILPTHHRILNLLKLPRLLKILTEEDFISNEKLELTRYTSLRLRGISYDFYKQNIKHQLVSQKYMGSIYIDYPYNLDWEDYYHGLHFTSSNLHHYEQHKKDPTITYSASCHTKNDIKICNEKLFDFILISPVLCNHDLYTAINWSGFSKLSDYSYLPTYALGGLSSESSDFKICTKHNGFGISGISKV